ncbi:MAG: nucleotidyltransferase domain-containing protein [Candidatus Thermoplasmatota archaeon]|nr:nucleotidyltransferase domain-containing protein [Candidatus Thermoplasmatota archaeon]
MIIERESEIKVLRNFYNNPFDYFSIAEISEKTRLSRNWVYKIIDKFERFNILDKFGKKYKLDFTNLFCKRLKLLFDSEYLCSLNQETRRKIFDITNRIIFEIQPISIVLVGSVALNKQKKESDVDFFVISNKKREIPYFENCNVILLNEREFKEKYLKGDDFVISALLFGKIIYDENIFIKFFESPPPIFSQEIIQEKIKYCEKLEERVYTLLRIDKKKAKEELLYLALQTARIILLKNKIAPKTKYDIAEQVNQFDKNLAKIIRELIKKKKLSKEEMIDHIKTCMEIVR